MLFRFELSLACCILPVLVYCKAELRPRSTIFTRDSLLSPLRFDIAPFLSPILGSSQHNFGIPYIVFVRATRLCSIIVPSSFRLLAFPLIQYVYKRATSTTESQFNRVPFSAPCASRPRTFQVSLFLFAHSTAAHTDASYRAAVYIPNEIASMSCTMRNPHRAGH